MDVTAKTPPLNIKDPEVYRLAKELSAKTGESLTEAVKNSLQERMKRQPRSKLEQEVIYQKIMRLVAEYREFRGDDTRPHDEIIGYDENGVPI